MVVVISAISTIIENRGRYHAHVQPDVESDRSMSPLVFIKAPTPSDSRQELPVARAGIMQPPSFPATAASRIPAVHSQISVP
jgi:hypothetical protein